MAEKVNVPMVFVRKSSPFSIEMDLALATSYVEEKAVIEGALKGGKLTNKHKLAAWERVRGRVNSVAGGNAKTSNQCKDRYRNMVTAITKRKWQVQATEGGCSPPPLSQAQQIIEGSLSKVKLEGIESPVDTFSGSFGADAECIDSLGGPDFPIQASQPQLSACDVVMLDSVITVLIRLVNDGFHCECYQRFTDVKRIAEMKQQEEPKGQTTDDSQEPAEKRILRSHGVAVSSKERPHVLPKGCIICHADKWKRNAVTRKRQVERLIQCETKTGGMLVEAAKLRKMRLFFSTSVV